MAKYVSKTISIYTYTFKMCNKDTNVVKDVTVDSFAEAKNPTQLRAIFDTSSYAKSNYFVTGEYTSVRFEMYRMPIIDFVRSGERVEPDITPGQKDVDDKKVTKSTDVAKNKKEDKK